MTLLLLGMVVVTGPGAFARTALQRCHAHASVNACDDAIRRNPSDLSLLVARGDTLMRFRRPAEALRAYQRVATLAPTTSGIQLKLEKAQAATAKRDAKPAHDKVSRSAPSKTMSNAEPDTQTH